MTTKTFRQASKALRIALLMAITEGMSPDRAVRLSYCHALNVRMLDILEDINRPLKGEKDEFDQIKMLNILFGDETPVIKQHLVDATEFIKQFDEDSVEGWHVSATVEDREWFNPPILRAFTITVGDVSKTFTDDGEIYAAS